MRITITIITLLCAALLISCEETGVGSVEVSQEFSEMNKALDAILATAPTMDLDTIEEAIEALLDSFKDYLVGVAIDNDKLQSGASEDDIDIYITSIYQTFVPIITDFTLSNPADVEFQTKIFGYSFEFGWFPTDVLHALRIMMDNRESVSSGYEDTLIAYFKNRADSNLFVERLDDIIEALSYLP